MNKKYDVCVIGGSCTGVFAAVAAARENLSVCLIEKTNCFGGVATNGLVNIWHSFKNSTFDKTIIGGLSQQTVDYLFKRSAVEHTPDNCSKSYTFDSEQLKFVLDEMVIENKITPILHTQFYRAEFDQNRIKSVEVINKDGILSISANFFIDCTGDGDLCRAAGVDSYFDKNLQPPTMCAKYFGIGNARLGKVSELIRDHGEEFGLEKDWGWGGFVPGTDVITLNADNHIFNVNCGNAEDLTRSEIEGRRKVSAVVQLLRKYMDKNIFVAALPSYIGVRETYHIKSLHKVTSEELLGGKRYDDAIMNGSYRVDYHHAQGSGITFKYLDGTQEVIAESGAKPVWSRWREEDVDAPTFYQVPYRSLVPASSIENLLFAGRMIDADREAFSALRVMVNCNQMGEAAGSAAAIAVKNKTSAARIDTNRLRTMLADNGAVIL